MESIEVGPCLLTALYPVTQCMKTMRWTMGFLISLICHLYVAAILCLFTLFCVGIVRIKIVLWLFYLFNELSHRDQHFSIYALNQVYTYLPCWILLHSKNSQCEKMVLRLSYLHKVISYIPVKLNLYIEVSPSLLTLPHSMQEFPMWK